MLNIIANPKSLKKGEKLLRKIEETLKEREVEYRVLFSEKEGASRELAKCLTEGGEKKLVVFGGDGTLNEVLSGIANPEECELGLIPAGTGNDFAVAAKIPNGIQALELILDSEPQYTDFIQFDDGRRSMNIAGMGMDVDILQRCETRKYGSKKSKYFRALISSLIHYKGLELEISADGGEATNYNCLIACLCNGHQFGGGIPIRPGAVIDDGVMELQIYTCPPKWKLPYYLIKIMGGTLYKKPLSHHIRCKEATIVCKNEGSVAQYDGELKPCNRLGASIVTGKLKMFRG